MISPDIIAEWKRVIAAATPGPWYSGDGQMYAWGVRSSGNLVADVAKPHTAGMNDTAYIALACTVFPELLEAYEALQAEVERLSTELKAKKQP